MGKHKRNCQCPWHGGHSQYENVRKAITHKEGCLCAWHRPKKSTAITVSCFICGKEIKRRKDRVEQSCTGVFFCNTKCQDSIEARRKGYRTGPPSDLTYRAKALAEYGEQCSGCGLRPTWNGKPITLEVDHIDGDRRNNIIENLRVLCPNCHSQTPTYKGKKRGD